MNQTPSTEILALTLAESVLIGAAADVPHATVMFDWPLPRPDLKLDHHYPTPAHDILTGARVVAHLVEFERYPESVHKGKGAIGFRAYWMFKPSESSLGLEPPQSPHPSSNFQEFAWARTDQKVTPGLTTSVNPPPLEREIPLFPESLMLESPLPSDLPSNQT